VPLLRCASKTNVFSSAAQQRAAQQRGLICTRQRVISKFNEVSVYSVAHEKQKLPYFAAFFKFGIHWWRHLAA